MPLLSSDFAPRGWSGLRSAAGATGSNPWQKHRGRRTQKQPKTVAVGCAQLRAERMAKRVDGPLAERRLDERVELGAGEFTGEFKQKYLQMTSF
jgi:hypothetical protein